MQINVLDTFGREAPKEGDEATPLSPRSPVWASPPNGPSSNHSEEDDLAPLTRRLNHIQSVRARTASTNSERSLMRAVRYCFLSYGFV